MDLIVAGLLGILTGLGLGGGSLLLLYLTLRGLPPQEARIISLLFFFPGSLVSIWRCRQRPHWCLLLPGWLCGVGAALLGSHLSRIWDPEPFQKALGCLLILLGLREVFHRKPSSCG